MFNKKITNQKVVEIVTLSLNCYKLPVKMWSVI